ncbi:MAG: DUF4861 family protein [Mariniphaga sp.]|nr:DUF4861 family protein [Mariniphaga sp.]
MKPLFIFLIGVFIGITACNQQDNSIRVNVKNPLNIECNDIVIEITDSKILDQILMLNNFTVTDKQQALPFHVINNNGSIKKLLVLCSFSEGESKDLLINKTEFPVNFKSRTQAEISVKEGGVWVWVTKSNGNEQFEYQGGTWKNVTEFEVPEQHTDHSFDIRYEGPGWESDKIGYRFYLDWRNAVDIFGKKVDTMVLQNVGLDGFDSYHEMSDWGVDVLKVGNSLGLGSIGHWENNKALRVETTEKLFSAVDYSGVLESKITTTYTN